MNNKLIEAVIFALDIDGDTNYNILDFGCGRGELLREIGSILKYSSKLIGINAHENDHQKALSNAVDNDIEFILSKFTNVIDFQDEYFDIVISIDTLECIPNRKRLVEEIYRILKPDGRILIAHWDWDTQVYNTNQQQILRKVIHGFADLKQDWMECSDGLMGRKLWGMFEGSQLFSGELNIFNLIETEFNNRCHGYRRMNDFKELVKAGKISEVEYEQIFNEMKELEDRGEYLYTLNSYIYSGRKC